MNASRPDSPRVEAQTSAARAAIEAALPHREPFLLVDAIAAQDDTSIETRWRVPADADWVRGHYPGQPITPGVLLCEHAVQSGALLVAKLLGGFRAADGAPVLTRLSDARFKRMVTPGEEVQTRVVLDERVGPAWFLSATVRCGGAKALTLSFALSAATALAEAAGASAAGTAPAGASPAGAAPAGAAPAGAGPARVGPADAFPAASDSLGRPPS
jgi:3-hydroxyacyl-[acyl-carrier-protein] dehydratase